MDKIYSLFVSYDNEPLSAITHLVGTLLSIAALTLLVVIVVLISG